MKMLIKKVQNYEGNIQKLLDKKFEGSCPCFWGRLKVNGRYVNLHGHCWRTTGDSIIGSCKCEHNGLHIKTKLDKKEIMPLIKAIKKQLDSQKWYSKWDLVWE